MASRLLLRARLFWCSSPCPGGPSGAALRVDVNQGNIQPLPIAIPDFLGTQPGDATVGQQIAGVVRADLDRSGIFRPLESTLPSSSRSRTSMCRPPSAIAVINAQALVTGMVAAQPDGRLRVDFRLWDVFGESQMLGLQYFTAPANWRRIAHMISDAIYQRITAKKAISTRESFSFPRAGRSSTARSDSP